MTDNKLKIGISVGDINGIGLEVILKTLGDKRILNFCTPIIYGSTKVVSYHKNIIKVKELSLHNAADINSINPKAVNIINCWLENVKITLGKCTADGGKYASFSLEQAVEDLRAGHIDALVTAPINKKAMQLSGFEYPGHTEYLTNKFGAEESLMFMVYEGLRVGLVTNHIPISKVSETITTELVLQKIKLMDESLKMDFGIDKPAIAVLGLNPHAGDSGVMGNEEAEVILPAIEAAKAEGILAIGPYAADGFFGSGNFSNFDGILAMYHDQGLAPFKTLSFGNGINFTGGLPVIRTSPDHGTGFDIAGKNAADPASFRQALYLAIDSAKQRAEYIKMTENPLKIISLNNYEKKEAKKKKEKEKDNRPQKKSNNTEETSSNSKKEEPKPANQNEESEKQLSVEERLALAAEKKKTDSTPKKTEEKTEPVVENITTETTAPKEEPKAVEEVTVEPTPVKEEVKVEKEAKTVEKEEVKADEEVKAVEETIDVEPTPLKEEVKTEEEVKTVEKEAVLKDNIIETMEPISNLTEEKEGSDDN